MMKKKGLVLIPSDGFLETIAEVILNFFQIRIQLESFFWTKIISFTLKLRGWLCLMRERIRRVNLIFEPRDLPRYPDLKRSPNEFDLFKALNEPKGHFCTFNAGPLSYFEIFVQMALDHHKTYCGHFLRCNAIWPLEN